MTSNAFRGCKQRLAGAAVVLPVAAPAEAGNSDVPQEARSPMTDPATIPNQTNPALRMGLEDGVTKLMPDLKAMIPFDVSETCNGGGRSGRARELPSRRLPEERVTRETT